MAYTPKILFSTSSETSHILAPPPDEIYFLHEKSDVSNLTEYWHAIVITSSEKVFKQIVTSNYDTRLFLYKICLSKNPGVIFVKPPPPGLIELNASHRIYGKINCIEEKIQLKDWQGLNMLSVEEQEKVVCANPISIKYLDPKFYTTKILTAVYENKKSDFVNKNMITVEQGIEIVTANHNFFDYAPKNIQMHFPELAEAKAKREAEAKAKRESELAEAEAKKESELAKAKANMARFEQKTKMYYQIQKKTLLKKCVKAVVEYAKLLELYNDDDNDHHYRNKISSDSDVSDSDPGESQSRESQSRESQSLSSDRNSSDSD